ncbi:MAG: hypothetical protein J6Y78_14910 [Paludibacteraceae bacterium]|nr:hypothetical protein [Paludibacteraceae bacterium]
MKEYEVIVMEKDKLRQKADEILSVAKSNGVDDNFFFTTTFERYLTQLDILDELKKAIEEEGMLVSKEYVKGRKNLYTNPAVSDYNRTTDSANKTVSTLMRIIKSFGDGGKTEEIDPLMEILND